MAREIRQDIDTMVAVECAIGERCGWGDARIAAIEADIAAARVHLLKWRFA